MKLALPAFHLAVNVARARLKSAARGSLVILSGAERGSLGPYCCRLYSLPIHIAVPT
ncbi:MAG: hypothetical protein Q7J56_00970 [Deltaproteobacteria bacterium]|nr:hypothetical protein [Deltaproteobacteria bacterium]